MTSCGTVAWPEKNKSTLEFQERYQALHEIQNVMESEDADLCVEQPTPGYGSQQLVY